MRTILRLMVGVAVVVIWGLVAVITFGIDKAYPHDAAITVQMPLGWSYPYECCSDYDCREIPASWVMETPYGYMMATTGELLPYNKTNIKESLDGEYHWCSVAGKDDSKTICLFVPPKGF